MRLDNVKILKETMDVTDEKLIEMYKNSEKLLLERKELYDEISKNFDENNYYDFLIVKLYYGFAKEEFERIVFEVKKREIEEKALEN
jgi:hypothetical protein